MKFAKVCLCVALVGAIGVGTAGCGIFDLINAGLAAAKLFNGAANEVTADEWVLMSQSAANVAGDPDLALTAEEAAALAEFLAENEINDLGDIGDTAGLTGLDDLAAAFQDRADAEGSGYDLTDPADADAFFEDYGQELADGLAQTLADLGIEIPDGD